MKWCLSGKQTNEFLKKADEIMVDWDNGKTIFDIIEINPTARIIVRPKFDQILTDANYKWLQEQKILCKDNFAVAAIDDQQANECKKYNIPWFFAYPCRTFLQLNRAKAMGASDVYIEDELCHNLDLIEKQFPELTIRVIANSAGWGTIDNNKYLDGLCGSWFRPEDLWQIDQIDVVEFKTSTDRTKDTKIQEQALYHIYAETHEWAGNVDDYVYDLKREGLINSLFDDNFQAYRNNCEMKCMKYNRCRHCEIYANLVHRKTAGKIKDYIEKL